MNFVDEKLAVNGFEDIIEISQFVELAFSLRSERLPKLFFRN
jgi:hypothetical protein